MGVLGESLAPCPAHREHGREELLLVLSLEVDLAPEATQTVGALQVNGSCPPGEDVEQLSPQ